MPTSVDVKNFKINTLTEAQYDTAVQGGVIGENELSLLTDVDLEKIQVRVLPTASADELGKIYQYIGATDSTYTNAYFYKCVSDGQDPATYSWEAVEVQASSGGLPDQTGQSGKFLTTDGTDASWETINALQNKAEANSSFSITDMPANKSYCTTLGIYASAGANAWSVTRATAYGYSANVGDSCTCIGASAQAGNAAYGNCKYNIAIGTNAKAGTTNNVVGAIQLGAPNTGATNNDSNTLKVANANGNFEMMSADGTIPKERLVNAVSKPSTMPELTVAGWSLDSGTNKYTQSVSVTGVTGTNTVFVSPAPSSAADYASSSVLCISQTTDSLTFQADSVPSNAITVNVVIMG